MKNKLLLLLAILLAFAVRFYKLGSFPALNADEAAIGYNTYSLIETGKDEHGNTWPIHFESFADYKPGLYFYLVLPFVKFFGLNAWSVRFPGALLGVATVWLLYFFIKELFVSKRFLVNGHWSNKKLPESIIDYQLIAIIASFFLAISPWHIHFSRGGWEVNVATFFITFGLYLFLVARRKKSLTILEFSAISFALSLYTYHAARIVVPLLLLGITFIYRDFIKSNLKSFAITALLGLVAILPLVKDLTKPQIMSRAAGVGLFADSGPLNRINEQRGEHTSYLSFQSKALHNKPINYSLAFLENWGEHFRGEFLFLSGDDIERNKVPETGQMYLLDILWFVIGVRFIIKSWKESSKLVLYWLVIAPTAAALTFQSPHALRSQNMVVPLTIITALGLTQVICFFKKKIKKKNVLTTGYLLLAALILWQFARYTHMYWVHMAKEYPFSSQYALKELVEYLGNESDKYEKIVITNRYDQPYILFLFYMNYPPEKFQKEHQLTPRDDFGFSTVDHFDKYYFQSIDFDRLAKDKQNNLIIGTDGEIYDKANIIKEIYGINDYKYFQIVAN